MGRSCCKVDAMSGSAIRVKSQVWSAMQRVLGIACGVILLEITAILVFPRSATQVRLPFECLELLPASPCRACLASRV